MATLPELPRGVTPYVVDLTISHQKFELRIMSEADEIGAAFDHDGRFVVRPRRGRSDMVDFFDEERSFLKGGVVVHNHPLGGTPSSADVVFAAEFDIDGMRIVCPSGLVYSFARPDEGWPSPQAIIEAADRSVHVLRAEGLRRTRQGLRTFNENEAEEFLLQERQNDLRTIGVSLRKGNVWEL